MGDQPGMVDSGVRGRCRVAIAAEVGSGQAVRIRLDRTPRVRDPFVTAAVGLCIYRGGQNGRHIV
jgi:hypothetical protein